MEKKKRTRTTIRVRTENIFGIVCWTFTLIPPLEKEMFYITKKGADYAK
jgi:hypothetical protein